MDRDSKDLKTWIALYALEKPIEPDLFSSGAFWGVILSSAFWIVIIQLIILITE